MLLTVLPGCAVLGLHQWVGFRGAAHSVAGPQGAPGAPWILVLGASVLPDGTPNHMLADRLAAAATVYRRLTEAGAAPRILLTGDGRTDDYHEPRAMRAALRRAGVPDQAMVEDPGGLRTITSMRRARGEFGIRRALVVTNGFHVARSVYLARALGIDAVGVPAPDTHRYSWRTWGSNLGREALARVLAAVEVEIPVQPVAAAPPKGSPIRGERPDGAAGKESVR